MKVVDNQAFSIILIVRFNPVPRNRIFVGSKYQEASGPTEGNFKMKAVGNQAFSVILIVRFILVPRNRIYKRCLGLLWEILY